MNTLPDTVREIYAPAEINVTEWNELIDRLNKNHDKLTSNILLPCHYNFSPANRYSRI